MSIQTELQDGVFVITIDNVSRMNSIGPKATADLAEAWVRSRDDGAIRVVVFTAAGDKAFCTGMDMSEADDLVDVRLLDVRLAHPVGDEGRPVLLEHQDCPRVARPELERRRGEVGEVDEAPRVAEDQHVARLRERLPEPPTAPGATGRGQHEDWVPSGSEVKNPGS